MDKTIIQQLGFSEGEAEIYFALIKLGSSSVMQLAKFSGRHRTHIYDTLEKLKEKGLISESIIDSKRYYSASDPENILDYLKEKEEKAKTVIDELKALQSITQKEIKVETFKGESGLRSALRDILREKKDYVGYGEGSQFEKVLPTFYPYYREQSKKLGIGLRLLFQKGVLAPSPRKGLQVKFLDYLSPSTTFIYADKVLILIWKPYPTAIRITDKQTTESYKSYFEVMWKMAQS